MDHSVATAFPELIIQTLLGLSWDWMTLNAGKILTLHIPILWHSKLENADWLSGVCFCRLATAPAATAHLSGMCGTGGGARLCPSPEDRPGGVRPQETPPRAGPAFLPKTSLRPLRTTLSAELSHQPLCGPQLLLELKATTWRPTSPRTCPWWFMDPGTCAW